MPDEADFLRTISAEPREHTHSLVYADWLDENGKPNTARVVRGAAERVLSQRDSLYGHYSNVLFPRMSQDNPHRLQYPPGWRQAMAYEPGSSSYRHPWIGLHRVPEGNPESLLVWWHPLPEGTTRQDVLGHLAALRHEGWGLDPDLNMDVDRYLQDAFREPSGDDEEPPVNLARRRFARAQRVSARNAHPVFNQGVAARVGVLLRHIINDEKRNWANDPVAEIATLVHSGNLAHLPLLGKALREEGHHYGTAYAWHQMPRGIALDEAFAQTLRDDYGVALDDAPLFTRPGRYRVNVLSQQGGHMQVYRPEFVRRVEERLGHRVTENQLLHSGNRLASLWENRDAYEHQDNPAVWADPQGYRGWAHGQQHRHIIDNMRHIVRTLGSPSPSESYGEPLPPPPTRRKPRGPRALTGFTGGIADTYFMPEERLVKRGYGPQGDPQSVDLPPIPHRPAPRRQSRRQTRRLVRWARAMVRKLRFARSPDTSAFHRAVAAVPHDRTTRGVFADYLEERGLHADDRTLDVLRNHEGPVWTQTHGNKVHAGPAYSIQQIHHITRTSGQGWPSDVAPDFSPHVHNGPGGTFTVHGHQDFNGRGQYWVHQFHPDLGILTLPQVEGAWHWHEPFVAMPSEAAAHQFASRLAGVPVAANAPHMGGEHGGLHPQTYVAQGQAFPPPPPKPAEHPFRPGMEPPVRERRRRYSREDYGALLAHVRANPGDQAGVAALSDWLAEHGHNAAAFVLAKHLESPGQSGQGARDTHPVTGRRLPYFFHGITPGHDGSSPMLIGMGILSQRHYKAGLGDKTMTLAAALSHRTDLDMRALPDDPLAFLHHAHIFWAQGTDADARHLADLLRQDGVQPYRNTDIDRGRLNDPHQWLSRAGVPGGRGRGRPRRFARPNKDNPQTFIDALRRLRSSNQQQLRKVAAGIANSLALYPAHARDALHDTAGGLAVPGVALAAYRSPDPETVRYAGAWLGLLTQTPSQVVFHVRRTGPDSIVKWHMAGDGQSIREKLDRHGIHSRVIMPEGNGFNVLVFDQGKRLRPRLREFANTHGVVFEESHGKGEVIGGSNPAESRDRYRKVIEKYEGVPTSPKKMSRRGRVKKYALADERATHEVIRNVFAPYDDRANQLGSSDWSVPERQELIGGIGQRALVLADRLQELGDPRHHFLRRHGEMASERRNGGWPDNIVDLRHARTSGTDVVHDFTTGGLVRDHNYGDARQLYARFWHDPLYQTLRGVEFGWSVGTPPGMDRPVTVYSRFTPDETRAMLPELAEDMPQFAEAIAQRIGHGQARMARPKRYAMADVSTPGSDGHALRAGGDASFRRLIHAHPMRSNEPALLADVYVHHGALADWLQERDDPRHLIVRRDMETHTPEGYRGTPWGTVQTRQLGLPDGDSPARAYTPHAEMHRFPDGTPVMIGVHYHVPTNQYLVSLNWQPEATEQGLTSATFEGFLTLEEARDIFNGLGDSRGLARLESGLHAAANPQPRSHGGYHIEHFARRRRRPKNRRRNDRAQPYVSGDFPAGDASAPVSMARQGNPRRFALEHSLQDIRHAIVGRPQNAPVYADMLEERGAHADDETLHHLRNHQGDFHVEQVGGKLRVRPNPIASDPGMHGYFHQAIRAAHAANPREPDPDVHFQYADYLEEHGRPWMANVIRQAASDANWSGRGFRPGHVTFQPEANWAGAPEGTAYYITHPPNPHMPGSGTGVSVYIHPYGGGALEYVARIPPGPEHQGEHTAIGNGLHAEGLGPHFAARSRLARKRIKKKNVGRKIKKLEGEGKKRDQAIAIALSMAGQSRKD